jgi:radical SAM protein with 4Fe4S-binding SPASM domain
MEVRVGHPLSKSINCTIMPESVAGLSQMPDVARSLGIDTVCIVPYYYLSERMGTEYERLLKTHFDCNAFSWHGFRHECSGVDIDLFLNEHRKYLANLEGLRNFPYMEFSPEQYRQWFSDAASQVGPVQCENIESLMDIQPSGDVNFCVDFPDYSFGNVRNATIETLWNSPRAERFRQYRRRQPLPVCFRCGAKYMSLIGR